MVGGEGELLHGLELERERESGKGMRVRERAGGGLVGVGLGLTRGPEAREEGRGSKVMYA